MVNLSLGVAPQTLGSIENPWSKLKTHLGAVEAHTSKSLCAAITEWLAQIT